MVIMVNILKDHIEAAKYLQGLTYVDGDNIGEYGAGVSGLFD